MFWWFFWLLLIVLGAVVFWQRGVPERTDTAIDILRGKFAAGEISEEDYARRLAVLQGRPTAPPPPRGLEPPTVAPHA